MWRRLFGEHGTKNVITLFHKPSYAPSTRVLNLLKQSRANSAASSTIDQASPTTPVAPTELEDFELDVQEAPPTEDQLRSILEYVGSQNIGDVVKGAMTEGEALRVLERDNGSFARPLVVDWHQGRVVVGDNESKILQLIQEAKKARQ